MPYALCLCPMPAIKRPPHVPEKALVVKFDRYLSDRKDSSIAKTTRATVLYNFNALAANASPMAARRLEQSTARSIYRVHSPPP